MQARHLFFAKLFTLILSYPLAAAESQPAWKQPTQNLIDMIEKNDKASVDQAADWHKIKLELQRAAEEVSSKEALLFSFRHILSHWQEGSWDIVAPGEARHAAYQATDASVPDFGISFRSRGSEWTVESLGPRYAGPLRRGDRILNAGFHPALAQPSLTLELKVKNDPMLGEKTKKVSYQMQPFSQLVLDKTQKLSRLSTFENKRICEEKPWLWLNSSTSLYLASRLKDHLSNCDAVIFDLRSTFGQLPKDLAIPSRIKAKVYVLINKESRQGAIAWAYFLKKHSKAILIGEATAAMQELKQTLAIPDLSWLVLQHRTLDRPLQPDRLIEDKILYAEGIDEVYEAAIARMKRDLQ